MSSRREQRRPRRGAIPGTEIALALLLVALLARGCGDGGDAPRAPSPPGGPPATEGRQPAEPGGERPPGAQPGGELRGVPVVEVVDGDTIRVDLGGRIERVRYIGIDTPETAHPTEPVQCFGPQASAANRRLVDGRRVTLRFDRELRDRYGRLLAYVYRGRRFVNAELVRIGAARTLEIEPNTARAPRLRRLEAAAGRAGRGLWGACEP